MTKGREGSGIFREVKKKTSRVYKLTPSPEMKVLESITLFILFWHFLQEMDLGILT